MHAIMFFATYATISSNVQQSCADSSATLLAGRHVFLLFASMAWSAGHGHFLIQPTPVFPEMVGMLGGFARGFQVIWISTVVQYNFQCI
jgi:hypothetical protein